MSFAEVDESDVQFYKGDSAPYVNTDIMTDDYSSAVPAAFRSPQQQQPKPSFGLRQQTNSTANQQQRAPSPSMNKGSVAKKLPIRPGANSFTGLNNNNTNSNASNNTPRGNNGMNTPRSRVVTFTDNEDGENTNVSKNGGDTESRIRDIMMRNAATAAAANANNNNSISSSSPYNQNKSSSVAAPSFLSGMFATMRKKEDLTPMQPSFDEEDELSPPPPTSKPPIVIQSAERRQQQQKSMMSMTTSVVLPTMNFGEYENEDEQSPPRVPPGLTPETNNNQQSSSSPSATYSPRHEPQYYKNLFNSINNNPEQEIDIDDNQLNNNNKKEPSVESREQSLESALGIRAILNNNNTNIVKPTTPMAFKNGSSNVFGRRASSLEQNHNNNQRATNSYASPVSNASSTAPNAPRYQPAAAGAYSTTSANFEEVDDSPPGVSFSEFLPSSANKKKKSQDDESKQNEDDEDYSPIKSALYHDPYLLKNQKSQQQESPAMDRLRFGYAAATTSLNSPSGNSKSVTFHHSQQQQDENDNHNTSSYNGQYYDPTSSPSSAMKNHRQQQNDEFVPKAAVPIASLLSAGRSTSPANSMDAVLGQRTASATNRARQESVSRQRKIQTPPTPSHQKQNVDLSPRPFSAASMFGDDDNDNEQQQEEVYFGPSSAEKQRQQQQTSLQLLQDNMKLHGEDDRDIRSFVRNLKDEYGQPVKQVSMSPERLNRNTFLLPSSTHQKEQDEEDPEVSSSSASSSSSSSSSESKNDNEDTKEGNFEENNDDGDDDLPPPSAYTIEKRRRDQEEAEYQKILKERDERERKLAEKQQQQENGNDQEEAISHHSPSVIGVRVQVPTAKIPIPHFEYNLDVSPDTREMQQWPIDRTPRGVPPNLELFNHPSVSPSNQKRNLDEETSSARRRQQAIDELTRPITSLQRKRMHEKFYSTGATVEERTIYIDKKSQELQQQHESKYSHTKIEGGDDLTEDEMAEFAPSSASKPSSRPSARADAHKAYLALRSKQASSSAFFVEGDGVNDDDDEDLKNKKKNTEVYRDHPSPLRNISHVSPSRRFTSPAKNQTESVSISRHKSTSASRRYASPTTTTTQTKKEDESSHIVRSPSASKRNSKTNDVVASIRRSQQLYSPDAARKTDLTNNDGVSPASSADSAIVQIRESGAFGEDGEVDVAVGRRVEVDINDEDSPSIWNKKRTWVVTGISVFVLVVIALLVLGILFL